MSVLSALPERYRLILCDLWGCVHDGYRLLPGAVERLGQWREEGRVVLFVTNAPRSAATVRRQLGSLGLPDTLYRGVVTAGEVGLAALLGRPVGFCGTLDDRADLEAGGLRVAKGSFIELACAGLDRGEKVADYQDRLRGWRSRDVLLHCLNPDRVVIHGPERMVCAGALADAYEALGGRVCWYGKPFETTYVHALELADNPPKDAVLAIGDGWHTDMAGAARLGIDAVFVEGGIHAGEPAPAFDNGWRPLAVVPLLA
ncbi:HAD hydrolase-like protein [uncultured Sphingomonas sp.]|uniref:HAD hydrolase-like protein n=1 Tax=uncultured Sphingomonas sp. TaxID=158754 RepID=UPI0025F15608|nr:HAD hydrolase-like protein [uncultured Sphingomonas sp.]